MIKCTILTEEEMKSINSEINSVKNKLEELVAESDNLSSDERSSVRLAMLKLENLESLLGLQ